MPGGEKSTEIKIGADAIPSGQELVNIDFPELTEIKDIVKAVALWTGKNVILDRQVAGKVQIIAPRRVTKEEAYQDSLLRTEKEERLRMKGFPGKNFRLGLSSGAPSLPGCSSCS